MSIGETAANGVNHTPSGTDSGEENISEVMANANSSDTREGFIAPPGAGIVTSLGWTENEEGTEVFRAIVEFPNGPPDLPLSVVFKHMPVEIVIAKAAEQTP